MLRGLSWVGKKRKKIPRAELQNTTEEEGKKERTTCSQTTGADVTQTPNQDCSSIPLRRADLDGRRGAVSLRGVESESVSKGVPLSLL